jgi:predicted PurR-regulated permease PerM
MRVAHTSRDSQIASVAGWALLVALVYVIYRVVAPLLSPLGWAAVFAIVVHPLYVRLARHWGSSGAALVQHTGGGGGARRSRRGGLLGGAVSFGALGLVIGPVVLAVALTLPTAYADTVRANHPDR